MMSLFVSNARIHLAEHKFGPFSRLQHHTIGSDGTRNINFPYCFGTTANRLPSVPRPRNGVKRVVCSVSAAYGPQNLQWVSAVSSIILMFAKGTPIQKSFMIPYFALQAPISAISWIKSEYGTWTAFLVLLVRMFYFIPGELEFPLQAMLLLIVAPYQSYNLRGTPAGAIVSLVIAGYLAYQHFSQMGSLRKAFDQGSIVSTVALVCVVSVPCIFLF